MRHLHPIQPHRLRQRETDTHLARFFSWRTTEHAFELAVELRGAFVADARGGVGKAFPLFVIDETVAHIKDGCITSYTYDPAAAKLVKA